MVLFFVLLCHVAIIFILVLQSPGREIESYLLFNIPINDTSFEMSIFWLSGTENQINVLKFSVI